jgi:hypothetical protein
MNQASNLISVLRWLPLSIVLSAGCAHNYSYWPTGPGLGDAPAARYPVPAEAPQGEIYVTSFGYTEMDVAEGRRANLLHARLAVVNQAPTPWTVDGREQVAAVPNQPTVAPAFLNTDAGTGPVYVVGPGQSKVFDLYFALPPPLDRPENLMGFELSWKADINGRPVVGRTTFQRFIDERRSYAPYPPFVSFHLGWGMGWWYGPYSPYRYPPVIRTYYYPPWGRAGPGWYGSPGWRGTPSGGGGWRGSPAGGGGWRGSPSGGGGGWRGSPGGGGGGWRGSPGGGGGGFRGGGGGGGWRGRGR